MNGALIVKVVLRQLGISKPPEIALRVHFHERRASKSITTFMKGKR